MKIAAINASPHGQDGNTQVMEFAIDGDCQKQLKNLWRTISKKH